jgi:hypothetical protein
MSGRSRFVLFCFSLTVAFVIHAESARAQTSDVVGIPGFGLNIPLGEAGGPESLGLSAASGITPGVAPPGFTPTNAIILTDPAGIQEPAGEPPGIPVSPGGPIASDIAVQDATHQGLFLLSDGDPQFANFLAIALGLPGVVLLEETGLPQVVSGNSTTVVTFTSDIPEPGTLALLGLGLLGMAAHARRARS